MVASSGETNAFSGGSDPVHSVQSVSERPSSHPSVLIDVSTVWWTRTARRTGIPRVEYEMARRLADRGATLVLFNPATARFHSVSRSVFEDATGEPTIAGTVLETYNHPTIPLRDARKLALFQWMSLFLSYLPGYRGRARWRHRAILFLARRFQSLSPLQRRRSIQWLRIESNLDYTNDFLSEYNSYIRRHSGQKPNALMNPLGQKVELKADHQLLLLGASWEFINLSDLLRQKERIGFRAISLIYDLVPLRRPELMFDDPSFQEKFEAYLRNTIFLSERLTAISAYVAQDVRDFIRDSDCPERPVTPIPLCSDLHNAKPYLTLRLQGYDLQASRYALFVSTINPRKNQQWAYQLWRRVIEQHRDKAIPLVFAGQRGWLSSDLFTVMQRDRKMWNKWIHFIEGPSDAELAYLYANCAFTLYPSETEGWGLPISESLSFGKYCLTADNSSLHEASQGLAFHSDIMDGAAWLSEISHLLESPEYLKEKSDAVKVNYRARAWDDLVDDVIAECRLL